MNRSEDASRWESHRYGSQPWGGESGIALVIVLWVLTLITVIAGQFAFTIRQEMDAVRRYKESAEAYYIAQAGLVEALIALVRENALEPGTVLEEEEEDEEDPHAEEAPSWRLNIPVGVSYKSDIDKARALCLEAVDEVERIHKEPKPACLIKGFGNSSVDLELSVWIDDPEAGRGNIQSAVYERIWRKFIEHGVEIPYPQRDLHIRSPETIRVATEPAPRAQKT